MSPAVSIALSVAALAAFGTVLAAVAAGRGRRRNAEAHDDMSLSGALDAAPLPIIVSHQDSGRVFLANAAARALFAGPDGALATIAPEEFYEDPTQRATLLARLAGRGLVEDFPARLIARDGRRLDMRVSARRIRYAGEDALCVILRDVTAHTSAEARHRAVLAHLDAGVLLFDGEGRVSYANPAAGRLLGRPSAALPGQSWAALVGRDSAAPLMGVLAGGGAIDDALIGLRGGLHGPDATTWLRLTATTLGTEGGGDRAVCSLVDATAAKAADDALADSAEALRAILDSAPMPILVLRRRGGDILLANAAAQQIFTAPGGGPGHWLDGYMDRDERRAALAELRRRGALRARDVIVRPDGRTPRWMRLSAGMLSYFGVEAVMVAFSDATETRRLGRALAAAEADRRRAEDDLRRVAAAAEADLAAPLRAAESALDSLRQRLDDRAPAEVAEAFSRGLAGARLAERRLEALIAYARTGLDDWKPTMVDLAEVLRDIRGALSVAIARHDAVLQSESHLPVLRADRAALASVLEHLIDNALTFRHPDRRPVVRLSAHQEKGEGGEAVWHLRVADNGQGIPHRHFERAFALFQRLHPDGPDAGPGIGLALCRRIVLRHGGRIWLDSTEGEGTTVHITLPATPSDTVPLPRGEATVE